MKEFFDTYYIHILMMLLIFGVAIIRFGGLLIDNLKKRFKLRNKL